MATARTTARRHRTARFGVAALHLLLLVTVLRDQAAWRIAAPPVDPEPLRIHWLPASPRAARTTAGAARRATTTARPFAARPPSRTSAPTGIAVAPQPRAQTDWAAEARRVAGATPLAKVAPRTDCEDTDRPGAMLPRCTPRRPEFSWGHEPRRVEFAGGLPFVRVGKRCLVGLGFFGCAIGTLPDANGHLFDERKDLDRPRSSVPDAPDATHP
jgi:hypothetical protein